MVLEVALRVALLGAEWAGELGRHSAVVVLVEAEGVLALVRFATIGARKQSEHTCKNERYFSRSFCAPFTPQNGR